MNTSADDPQPGGHLPPLSHVQLWAKPDGGLVARLCHRESGRDGKPTDDGQDIYLEFDGATLPDVAEGLIRLADRVTGADGQPAPRSRRREPADASEGGAQRPTIAAGRMPHGVGQPSSVMAEVNAIVAAAWGSGASGMAAGGGA